MRKSIGIILCAMVCVFCLTACADYDEPSGDSETKSGYGETNSWEYQLATGFGVDSPEITMIRVCLYGGVIVTVMGVILLVVGMAKDTSK